ncbi:MAG: hypothetical protein JSR44_07915 [Spirochaetes bacterium]|nr:hypothetical protein [Spirochaetota bacterium]
MRYFWIIAIVCLALVGGSIAFQACGKSDGGSAASSTDDANTFTLSGDTL